MLLFMASLGDNGTAEMLADLRNEQTQPDAPFVAEPSPMDEPIEDEEAPMEDELALPEDVATEDEEALQGQEEEPLVETPEEVPVV